MQELLISSVWVHFTFKRFERAQVKQLVCIAHDLSLFIEHVRRFGIHMVQGPWSHSLALVKWQCVKWDFFQRRSNVIKSRRKNRILSLDYGLLICCKLALPFPENFKKNAGERVLLSAILCPLTALQLLSVVTIPCFTSRDLFQLYHGKPRTFEQLCR